MSLFFFGATEQTAQLYVDMVTSSSGPGMRDIHFDEMSHQELINQMVYLGMAARNAALDQNEEVAELLHSWYDEAFARVAHNDEGFRRRLLTGAIQPLRAGRKRNKGYYLKLAGLA